MEHEMEVKRGKERMGKERDKRTKNELRDH
jgi:hypothetical protein